MLQGPGRQNDPVDLTEGKPLVPEHVNGIGRKAFLYDYRLLQFRDFLAKDRLDQTPLDWLLCRFG